MDVVWDASRKGRNNRDYLAINVAFDWLPSRSLAR